LSEKAVILMMKVSGKRGAEGGGRADIGKLKI
jgi:hypothetical protein